MKDSIVVCLSAVVVALFAATDPAPADGTFSPFSPGRQFTFADGTVGFLIEPPSTPAPAPDAEVITKAEHYLRFELENGDGFIIDDRGNFGFTSKVETTQYNVMHPSRHVSRRCQDSVFMRELGVTTVTCLENSSIADRLFRHEDEEIQLP